MQKSPRCAGISKVVPLFKNDKLSERNRFEKLIPRQSRSTFLLRYFNLFSVTIKEFKFCDRQ